MFEDVYTKRLFITNVCLVAINCWILQATKEKSEKGSDKRQVKMLSVQVKSIGLTV